MGPETAPGLDVVPADGDHLTWGDWVNKTYRTNYHPIVTASMLPKEKGGVVSEKLVV